jgi:uroporphyrin-III C-methyltransferase/precorrin-2 dehydrogenase/sirohydrochlorin ferrochelatase
MELLPVFLILGGRQVLVVGGGAVAASKLASLQRAGAEITVVAPRMHASIRGAGVTLVERPFRPADLDGAWLVVAAATPPVNAEVARHAARRRIFVNAVDDPANASAYLGGVLRRAGVTIAVSTNGEAPALAGVLREAIDALLPADLDRWAATARSLRAEWRTRRVPMAERRPQLIDALKALYPEAGVKARPAR